jgi:hypothetical protein
MGRYLVTPKMDCDLHKVLEGNILQSQHVQFFLYQILRALKVRACLVCAPAFFYL